jgi:hypothetical protein
MRRLHRPRWVSRAVFPGRDHGWASGRVWNWRIITRVLGLAPSRQRRVVARRPLLLLDLPDLPRQAPLDVSKHGDRWVCGSPSPLADNLSVRRVTGVREPCGALGSCVERTNLL